jgi:thiol-disulfide isomerase/thioredoxin
MKRMWMILATLLLCSCSQTEPSSSTNSPSNVNNIDSSVVSEPVNIDNVVPAEGLSPEEMETAARNRFAELQEKFNSEMADLKKLIAQASSEEEKRQLLTEKNPAVEISQQMMINAKQYPGTNGGRDSALFAIGQIKGPRKIEMMELLATQYPDKVQLTKIVDELKKEVPSKQIEQLFNSIIAASVTEKETAYSMFGYAEYLSQFPFFRKTLIYNPAYAERLPANQLDYINRPRTKTQNQELSQLLRQLIEKYGDLPYKRGKTFGEVATSELFEHENLQVGQVAPDIEGKDLDGIPFRLSDYRGKVVMLDFWGHWCMPCRAMYDHERFMTKRLANKPFVLLGVNSDRRLETAREAVRDETLSWRHFWNGKNGTDGPISRTWNVKAWPTVYLLDQDGVIRYKSVLGEEIDDGVEQLMAEMGYEVQLSETSEAVGAGN